ncbi:TrkH family potassium uptake protein [Niameybacter sp.]|uniref:TrkH family potassium uptake protein n=1 Tax=Niameybacter sp. TaxID=2033640 RepID=UPI002FE6F266
MLFFNFIESEALHLDAHVSFKKMTPAKVIALSFVTVILIGAILLTLPIASHEGIQVSFIDALFTSTSAVCVTGLVVVDTADTFNAFGQSVVAILIQIGGLGVTSLGVGLILIAGRRVGFKQRTLVREAWNINNFKGIVKLVKAVLLLTLIFEGIGALLSFIVFRQDYPTGQALGISMFHSIASFNNAGFDILGSFQNLIPYQNNLLLNLTTCVLIIFGGLGFLVILDLGQMRGFKHLTLHSKVVILTTVSLLVMGTLFLKGTEEMTWLGAFFQSTSARTAGFCTYSIGELSNAGLWILTILMFIGASPGSTGGGIKTSTVFVLIQFTRSVVTNQHCKALKRSIPDEAIVKATIITLLALGIVGSGAFLLCVLEPEYSFMQHLFEVTSAFGTVGLSTGITPSLSGWSKILLIVVMYIGRLGPLTIASLWFVKNKSNLHYTEEMITIG